MFKPRITPKNTKGEKPSGALARQAALPNQLCQASLLTRLFPNRSIRSANDPALDLDSGRARQWNAVHIPAGSPLDSHPMNIIFCADTGMLAALHFAVI